ncbi:hypothetical protein R1flu_014259 [Riccia fluitans]|uniref:Uncharacterized protein n=1 Tax=Riccia fluitans TaxID=41844 RepID=A0ABD1YFX7_9MARC
MLPSLEVDTKGNSNRKILESDYKKENEKITYDSYQGLDEETTLESRTLRNNKKEDTSTVYPRSNSGIAAAGRQF